MKKVFVFAIAAGMFFVACNGGSTPAADSTATTVDTMNAAPVATPAVDSAAAAVAPAADSAAVAAPAADSAAHAAKK
ncbi:hypothetical protein [Chitinophaga flava]|uniref:Entericidin n=1 Tax=Chitinophaga flava TaxID=2259036 RepID=A0A365Y0Y3_9BACT|nr:hypothetical protein [Chitinophaga flava]RBL92276.1 hypothetical protein DF182_06695 [Chitinophaga flava]